MVSTRSQSAAAASPTVDTPPSSSSLNERLIKTEIAPRVSMWDVLDAPPPSLKLDASAIKTETTFGSQLGDSLPAPLVKLEKGEVDASRAATSQALVQYSSSPPPLVEDRFSSGVDSFTSLTRSEPDLRSEQTALRDEWKLATYECAELSERNRKLENQHKELLKLASTYSEVVRGTCSFQEPAISIDQLRVEAGIKGLRAKALEADVLRPVIAEAGGLQALLSSIDSVRSLIDEAGGLQELKDLVSDTQLLRISVDEAGGLQGLHNLISEVDTLRSDRQAYAQLRDAVGDLDELKSKAAKYDRLKVAFAEITGLENTGTGWKGPPIKSKSPATASAGINPARAGLMSAPPPRNDPDRDLYEARRPIANNFWKKTGSNDVPLGGNRLQTPVQSTGQTASHMSGGSSMKRKHDHVPSVNAKRPRIDLGRASALVQASLSNNHMDGSLSGGVANLRTGSTSIKSEETARPLFAAPVRSIAFMGASEPPRQNTSQDPGVTGQLIAARPSDLATVSAQQMQTGAPSFRLYPLALWAGTQDPTEISMSRYLRRHTSFPPKLGNFLFEELKKQINVDQIHLFNTMEVSSSACILSSLVEGVTRRGHARERTACAKCFSRGRPCALLQLVGDTITIVFLPIPATFRYGVSWNDQKYFVL